MLRMNNFEDEYGASCSEIVGDTVGGDFENEGMWSWRLIVPVQADEVRDNF